MSHAAARLYYWTVPGFGDFLNAKGLVIGHTLAWVITIGELTSGFLLTIGYKVRYATLFHIVILLNGVFMVHLPNGWFTVGQSTGGVEYSLLLLIVLLYIYSKYSRK